MFINQIRKEKTSVRTGIGKRKDKRSAKIFLEDKLIKKFLITETYINR